ncbi:PhzF family phenazine biosynthesis protein [Streptomyces alkaliphilus]|uniref:PhzF family phenazine biosynthesis protein n=1 Tax=Streptomyces alkaliphilus TaxID=1472722 RepID=UPI0011800F44|nr:PhzF family phenazine biosynthesis protein [Streptomyces alkaliphilus]MQS08231.1 PhzF family phenazine biosynthesis isomerase [Streptomyces alkaliphilus]
MRIHVVDAFTDRPFAGNPAAVCPLDSGDWPDAAWMQRLAAELNLSETAFALPLPPDGEADWAIRWFTPVVEEKLCGHATLATAHVLRTSRGIDGTVRFASRYHGLLTTHTHRDGSVTLDFPAAPGTAVPAPDDLARALGATPEATFTTGTLGDLLAVLPDEAGVRAASPDLRALAEVTRRNGFRGVIITAPAADPGRGYDFVSRYFSPADGIPEDPVTGSAHTALAPYWSARLGRDGLTGLQASARGGSVHTEVHGDRVRLSGRAVTVLEGRLHSLAEPGSATE